MIAQHEGHCPLCPARILIELDVEPALDWWSTERSRQFQERSARVGTRRWLWRHVIAHHPEHKSFLRTTGMKR